MGLLTSIIASMIHLGLVLMDITLAFLVVRLLRQRFSCQLLEAFDRAGSPLVSQVNQALGQRIESALGKSLTEAQLTAASMLVLVAIRTAVVLLFNTLLAS